MINPNRVIQPFSQQILLGVTKSVPIAFLEGVKNLYKAFKIELPMIHYFHIFMSLKAMIVPQWYLETLGPM